MEITVRRVEQLLAIIALVLLAAGCIAILAPFTVAIMWAVIIALTTWPAYRRVRDLVKGHEAVARTARTAFGVADGANDQPTADLLTQRLEIHEKTAWMLRSMAA